MAWTGSTCKCIKNWCVILRHKPKPKRGYFRSSWCWVMCETYLGGNSRKADKITERKLTFLIIRWMRAECRQCRQFSDWLRAARIRYRISIRDTWSKLLGSPDRSDWLRSVFSLQYKGKWSWTSVVKTQASWSWQLISIQHWVYECLGQNLHSLLSFSFVHSDFEGFVFALFWYVIR